MVKNSGAVEIIRLNHEELVEAEEAPKKQASVPLYNRKIENNFSNFYENKGERRPERYDNSLGYNDLSHLIEKMKENRVDFPNKKSTKVPLEYTDTPFNTFPMKAGQKPKGPNLKTNFSFAPPGDAEGIRFERR